MFFQSANAFVKAAKPSAKFKDKKPLCSGF